MILYKKKEGIHMEDTGNNFSIDEFLDLVNDTIDELVLRTGEGNEDIVVNFVNELNNLTGGKDKLLALEKEATEFELTEEDFEPKEDGYEPVPEYPRDREESYHEVYSARDIKMDVVEGTQYLLNIVDTLLDDRAHLQEENEKLKKYIKGGN